PSATSRSASRRLPIPDFCKNTFRRMGGTITFRTRRRLHLDLSPRPASKCAAMPSFDILRNRDFRLLVWTRMFVTMALQAQAVIVGWQIYSITRDPWMLGLTGLAEAAPALVCALFAG